MDPVIKSHCRARIVKDLTITVFYYYSVSSRSGVCNKLKFVRVTFLFPDKQVTRNYYFSLYSIPPPGTGDTLFDIFFRIPNSFSKILRQKNFHLSKSMQSRTILESIVSQWLRCSKLYNVYSIKSIKPSGQPGHNMIQTI